MAYIVDCSKKQFNTDYLYPVPTIKHSKYLAGPEIARVPRVPGTREILRSYIMGPDEPALRSTLYYIAAPVDWNF